MKNLMKALAAFQQEMPPVHKGSSGHGYSYASLDEVVSKINPVMKKHGLGFTQLLNNGKIQTIIFHSESGEKLESEIDLNLGDLVYKTITKTNNRGEKYERDIILGFEGMNKAQAAGAMITYFRRYSLSSALGIITDADVDACGAKGETPSQASAQKKASTPQQSGTSANKEEDARPWLTEKSFEKLKGRILEGEKGILEKANKAFRMKKVYREELTTLEKQQ